MSGEHFELTSPFATINFRNRPKHWKLLTVGWMVFWAGIMLLLAYAYVLVIPEAIGFQKTVLLGIVLLITAVGGK